MATILESLKSISGYPIPESVFITASIKRDVRLTDDATQKELKSNTYRLAMADVMMWVSFAPNVRQSDIQYDLLFSDREKLRKAANAIYEELGDDAFVPETKTKFGYKGDRL